MGWLIMTAVALKHLEETKITSSSACQKSGKITHDQALFATRSKVRAQTQSGLKIIRAFQNTFGDALPQEIQQKIAFFEANSPQLKGDGSTNLAEYKQTMRDCYRCVDSLYRFTQETQPFGEEKQEKLEKTFRNWIYKTKSLATPEHSLTRSVSTRNVWSAPKARTPRELLTYTVDALGFLEGEFGDIPQAQKHPKIVSMLIQARDRGLDSLSAHCSEEDALSVTAEISPVIHHVATFLSKGIAGFLQQDNKNRNVSGYFKSIIHQLDAHIGADMANNLDYSIVENAKALPYNPVMGLRGSSKIVAQQLKPQTLQTPRKKMGFLTRLMAK